ncbi:HET-domain-containing protein, partial [Lentithecium fluviatile CBS 122367]
MRKPFSKLLLRWLGSPTFHRALKHPLFTFWKVRHQRRWDRLDRHVLHPPARRSVPNFHPCRSVSRKPLLEKFSYDRLNWASNEIRLIKILPQDPAIVTDNDYPIACQIISVSLNDNPKYIALSYAWEDTTLSRPLILNGKIFHATTSLDAALHQIRKMRAQNLAFREQYFWIDALSINQEDEIEKSWQVQRMNHIFQEAQYALVWLGPASEDSGKAMEALEQVGLNVASGTDPYDNKTLSTFNLLAGLYNEFSPSVKRLLMRSWWRRIWVVQEFASAQDVKFLCGDVQISWRPCFSALEALEKFQRALAEKGWRGNIGSQNLQQLMTEITAITGILRLFRIREALKSTQKRLSLWELLTLKRFGMLATNNRDFVYALTGIAEDAARKHLYPDYTKHAAAIYTEVAKCFLAEGRLRTLWLCSHPRHLPGLPSWVPDWS